MRRASSFVSSLSEIERLRALGFLHDPSRYMTDEEAAALPPQP
jgi:hypothetical protein